MQAHKPTNRITLFMVLLLHSLVFNLKKNSRTLALHCFTEPEIKSTCYDAFFTFSYEAVIHMIVSVTGQ